MNSFLKRLSRKITLNAFSSGTTSKKGQMEIMGLVIIVILITLGLLFLAKFSIDDKLEKKVFTRKGLAASTLNALLESTVSIEDNCIVDYSGSRNQPKLGGDILEDCALYQSEYFLSGEITDPGGSITNPVGYSLYRCNNRHSCLFFQEKATELIELTLGKWGKHYELHSRFITNVPQPQELIIIKDKEGKGCPGVRDSSNLFPIQVSNAGLVENELWVCD